MDNKELLNAIGKTDDRFIEEAAPEERSNVFNQVKDGPAIKLPGKDKAAGGSKGKTLKTSWKKWTGAIAAVLAVCVIGGAAISSGFGRMGSAKKAESMAAPESMYYGSQGFSSNGSKYDHVTEAEMPAMEAGYNQKEDYSYSNDSTGSLISGSVANLGKENLKLIYTANMNLQTSDFEESEKALSALVTKFNGYFESVKMSNNGIYSTSSYRHASYTVRIPAAGYADFVNAVGESSHIVGLSQSVQDVGESYFEIEGRLETLYTKQERLQALLKEAGNMTDIIELENALSDTEYQIDNLKGRLNHYDSLIGYSTVYIEMETVTRPGSSITQDTSFGARLARAFKDGLNIAADNFEYFILWVAENLIGIIIFAVIVILLIRFRPIKKLWRKLRKKDQQ